MRNISLTVINFKFANWELAMKKRSRLYGYLVSVLFIMSLLSGFTSCGDDDVTNQPALNIGGTLTLPFDANGKIWAVLIDNDIDGDNGFVKMGSGTCGAGTSVPYTVDGIPKGNYYIYAVVFIVGDTNMGPQEGDLIGIYGGEYPNIVPPSPNADISSSDLKFDIDLVVM